VPLATGRGAVERAAQILGNAPPGRTSSREHQRELKLAAAEARRARKAEVMAPADLPVRERPARAELLPETRLEQARGVSTAGGQDGSSDRLRPALRTPRDLADWDPSG
jgi:hypothetical protein